MDKRLYYQDQKRVAGYEAQRYAGPGGLYVNKRECGAFQKLLPEGGVLLDLPCGTGRVARTVASDQYSIFGADYSNPMIEQALQSRAYQAIVRADAFSLPFRDCTFDAIISSRFVFHYADLTPILHEARRVLRPEGVLIFDTYRWSPFMFPGTPKILGGRSYIHSDQRVKKAAALNGFKIAQVLSAFLFSPVIYRLCPAWAVKLFSYIEDQTPNRLLNVAFWKLIRVS